jgi:hypothetical protein
MKKKDGMNPDGLRGWCSCWVCARGCRHWRCWP